MKPLAARTFRASFGLRSGFTSAMVSPVTPISIRPSILEALATTLPPLISKSYFMGAPFLWCRLIPRDCGYRLWSAIFLKTFDRATQARLFRAEKKDKPRFNHNRSRQNAHDYRRIYHIHNHYFNALIYLGQLNEVCELHWAAGKTVLLHLEGLLHISSR